MFVGQRRRGLRELRQEYNVPIEQTNTPDGLSSTALS